MIALSVASLRVVNILTYKRDSKEKDGPGRNENYKFCELFRMMMDWF